jgi:competence protein ComEC
LTPAARSEFFMRGGMLSGLDVGEDVVSPYLWSRGLEQIEVVAVTHAHQDHIGRLQAGLETFRVQELRVGRKIKISIYRRVLATPRQRGVRIVDMKEGNSFVRGIVSGSILWPEDITESPTAKKDYSLVMRLTDGSQSNLLSGNIERPSERKILEENETLSANSLKVAHHDSKTSTIEPFLSRLHTSFAVISAGRNNSFGHPSPEMVERLKAAGVCVFFTDRDGVITATTDGRTLTVRTFLHATQ